jgi:hypothetical protein
VTEEVATEDVKEGGTDVVEEEGGMEGREDAEGSVAVS